MDRRNFLEIVAASATIPFLPNIKNKSKWFTHEHLMRIYDVVKNEYSVKIQDFEKMDVSADSKSKKEQLCFYFANGHMSNIIHRKTSDGQSEKWLVVSPSICERNLFFDYQLKNGWKKSIEEEVSPDIFSVGKTNNYQTYVDVNFPPDVAMQGIGFKKVLRIKHVPITERTPYGVDFYLGNPTKKNYGLIRC